MIVSYKCKVTCTCMYVIYESFWKINSTRIHRVAGEEKVGLKEVGYWLDMEEFSVFKSKDKSNRKISHHSLFVPHIPLFGNNCKRNSVSDLVALNQRYYDIDKKIAASTDASSLCSTSSSHDSTLSLSSSGHVVGKLTTKDQSYYEKYEPNSVQFKRKRIKDIDLRFTNTGIMPYCEYLRGMRSADQTSNVIANS